jgi:DNA-binding NtrC family response regulator
VSVGGPSNPRQTNARPARELNPELKILFTSGYTQNAIVHAEPKSVALKKALVVEDMALIRMATVDMLAEIGFAAAEAGDGMTALEIIDNDREIDVMIADLGLPGMSGRDLVAEVKRRRPGLKIVVASGDTDGKTRSDEALAGVVFLAKPYDIDQLRRAVLAS